jgi:putative heme transporter
VAGVLFLIVPQTVGQFDQLGEDLERSVREIEDWLVDGPLGLREEQVRTYTDSIVERLSGDSEEVRSRVITGAQVAAEVLAGLALTGVLTFFFIKDGDRISAWLLNRVRSPRRELARLTGRRAWETLAGYLRGTAITGAIDAVFIGIGLALLGVPLVIPLALLTFFGAFFPVIGAPLAGLVAVLIALVSGGPGTALAVLALVFVVQQVESYLLAPSIMGRMVRLHPVVVLVALTSGGVMAGIIGAFLAVPITAVCVAVVGEVRRIEAAELGPVEEADHEERTW